MNEVLTVLGPTPNRNLPGVDEWCINSAAIDPINKCAIVNSEDGHVYRWSFATNSLSVGLKLAPPTGEAYTSTAIGPDGAIYAINNATLFCCAISGGHATMTPGGGGQTRILEAPVPNGYFPLNTRGLSSILDLIILSVPLVIMAFPRFVSW
jgi:hypothetical protein